MTNYINQNIKLIRSRWGLTQEEFGYVTNATRGMIMQYERGGSVPKSKFIKDLAIISGINEEFLQHSELNYEKIPELSKEASFKIDEYRTVKDFKTADDNDDTPQQIELQKYMYLVLQATMKPFSEIRDELGFTLDEFSKMIFLGKNADKGIERMREVYGDIIKNHIQSDSNFNLESHFQKIYDALGTIIEAPDEYTLLLRENDKFLKKQVSTTSEENSTKLNQILENQETLRKQVEVLGQWIGLIYAKLYDSDAVEAMTEVVSDLRFVSEVEGPDILDLSDDKNEEAKAPNQKAQQPISKGATPKTGVKRWKKIN